MTGVFGDVAASARANKTTSTFVVFGMLFIVWCWYFDKKRRTDPDFRRKLRDRRLNARKCPKREPIIKLPDLRDNDAVMRFLLQEIKKGEERLGKGDEAGGVEHMAYAVAVCGQPHKLLDVLQQTLTAHVFGRLLDRLPSLSEEINENPTGLGHVES